MSERAREVLRQGSIKLRVNRSGMFQQMTFRVRVAKLGNISYNELFTDRVVELSELAKIAEEIGLPAESANGKAFPKGTAASDFVVN